MNDEILLVMIRDLESIAHLLGPDYVTVRFSTDDSSDTTWTYSGTYDPSNRYRTVIDELLNECRNRMSPWWTETNDVTGSTKKTELMDLIRGKVLTRKQTDQVFELLMGMQTGP